MKQVKQLLPLLMAIVMMAMCPTTMRADNITYTATDGTAGNIGEGFENLFDGNTGTKWCISNASNIYVEFYTSEALHVGSYTFITGDNTGASPIRNPKTWVLKGKVNPDDAEWTVIDTKTDCEKMPAANNKAVTFSLSKTTDTAYQYFRLEITHPNAWFQLSEISLSSIVPITYSATGGTTGNKGEGYQNLFDGDTDTKWCVSKASNIYVEFYTSEALHVRSYTFTTGDDTRIFPDRNPKTWVLKGKVNPDDAEWAVIDSKTDCQKMNAANKTAFNFVLPKATDTAYQYFRLEITHPNTTFQLSEISLSSDACNNAATDGTAGNTNEGYDNLFDGNTDTKWRVSNASNIYVEFYTPEALHVRSYTFTTGDDTKEYPSRNPKTWVLKGKVNPDDAEWTVIDSKTDCQKMTATNKKAFTFYLPKAPDKAYQFFRLEITHPNTTFQLSEFSLSSDACKHSKLQHIDAMAATCKPGKIECWECIECGQCYSSATASDENNIVNAVIPAGDHLYVDGVCEYCCDFDPTYFKTNTIVIGPESDEELAKLGNSECVFQTDSRYTSTVSLYTNDQIGISGNIASVAFYATDGENSLETKELKIYMKLVDADTKELDTSFDAANAGFTLVYSGNPTLSTSSGWETIKLDKCFAYDNTKNLLIAITRKSSSYNSKTLYARTKGFGRLISCAHYQSKAIDSLLDSYSTGFVCDYQTCMKMEMYTCKHQFANGASEKAATCAEGSKSTCIKCNLLVEDGKTAATGKHTYSEANHKCTVCDAYDTSYYTIITNQEDWAALREKVNNAKGVEFHVIIANDFTISEGDYTPVGNSSHPFTGTFRGENHTITLENACGSMDDFGLFGVTKNCHITGLIVKGEITVTGARKHIGSIAGQIQEDTQIDCCSFIGTINAKDCYDSTGGIAGYASTNFKGVIFNCFFKGKIYVDTSMKNNVVGGILGYFNDEKGNKPSIQRNHTEYNMSDYWSESPYINAIVGRIRAHADKVINNTYIDNLFGKRTAINTNGEAILDPSNKRITIHAEVNASNVKHGRATWEYIPPYFDRDKNHYFATQVRVYAKPNMFYHFDKWSDGGELSHYIELTSDIWVYAYFNPNVYSIKVKSVNNKYGTVSGGRTHSYEPYEDGGYATLTANYKDGYHFTMWDDEVTVNPRQVVLDHNGVYTAIFEACDYDPITHVCKICGETYHSYVYAGAENRRHFIKNSFYNMDAPYGQTNNKQTTVTLYTHDQIKKSGHIYDIAYFVSDHYREPKITTDLKIYMALVDSAMTELPSDFKVSDYKFVRVYNHKGVVLGKPIYEWDVITLDTPFEYDNKMNLLVAIRHSGNQCTEQLHLMCTDRTGSYIHTVDDIFTKDVAQPDYKVGNTQAAMRLQLCPHEYDSETHLCKICKASDHSMHAHYGMDGTCNWYITNDNELVVEPVNNDKGRLRSSSIRGWESYSSDIRTARFTKYVDAPNAQCMFDQCTNMEAVDLSNLHTDNAVKMTQMFKGCSALTTLDLSPLNTSNCEWMTGIFQGCTNLKSLTLGNFDMQKVTSGNSTNMFSGCNNLKTLTMKALPYMRYTSTTWSDIYTSFDKFFSGEGKEVKYDLSENSAVNRNESNSLPIPTEAPTFTRTFKFQWATVCLPFEMNMDEQDCEFYNLVDVVEDTLVVEQTSGILPPGTPAILHFTDEQFAAGSYSMVLKANSNKIDVSGDLSLPAINGLIPTGSYERFSLSEAGGYMISKDSFRQALGLAEDEEVFLPPFRCWLKAEDPDHAKVTNYKLKVRGKNGSTSIHTVDGVEMGVDNIYTLDGRRTNRMQKGVNIVRGKNGQIRKIMTR